MSQLSSPRPRDNTCVWHYHFMHFCKSDLYQKLCQTQSLNQYRRRQFHMIDLCIEHTALLAGRDIKEGKFLQPVMPSSSSLQSGDSVLQQIVLSYPGKYVSASKLNHLSKFRRDGGKQKVLMIFSALEHKQLGKIHQARNKVSASHGCQFRINVSVISPHYFY